MNQDEGIKITGSRISINGGDVWARDDIVIMNPNATSDDRWRTSVESIEKYMTNGSVRLNSDNKVVSSGGTKFTRSSGASLGDWVLIRPYYNTNIIYSKTFTVNSGTNTVNLTNMNKKSESGDDAFGDNAGWYKYTVYLNGYSTNGVTGENNTQYFTVTLTATGTDTRTYTFTNKIPFNP